MWNRGVNKQESRLVMLSKCKLQCGQTSHLSILSVAWTDFEIFISTRCLWDNVVLIIEMGRIYLFLHFPLMNNVWLTPLVRWIYRSANSTSRRFQASSRNLSTNVTRLFYQFHKPSKLVRDSSNLTWHVGTTQFDDSGPSPLATSWIFQTNFVNLLALCHFWIFTFHLIVSRSLPSRCSWFLFV